MSDSWQPDLVERLKSAKERNTCNWSGYFWDALIRDARWAEQEITHLRRKVKDLQRPNRRKALVKERALIEKRLKTILEKIVQIDAEERKPKQRKKAAA